MFNVRARVLTAFTASLALLFPASAFACNEPELGLGKTEASAGETVPFSIVNTDPGATYELYLNGDLVASGQDSDGADGTRGAFRMPQLGEQSRTIGLEAVVTHHGGDDVHTASPWRSAKTMRYRVPAPPAEPAPPQGDRAPAAAPAADPAVPVAPARPPSQAVPAVPGGVSVRPVPDPARTRARGSESATRGSAARGASRRTVVADASMSSRGAARSHAATGALIAGRRTSGTPARTAVERSVVASGASASASVHAWDSAHTGTYGGVSPSVAVASAFLLLGGLGAAGLGVARGRVRRPPPWVPPAVAAEARARDTLIEAELQEILAEARAREALGGPQDPTSASGRRDTAGAPS